MNSLITKAGKPRPKVIDPQGTYLSDCDQRSEEERPIWFGGQDRSEQSLTQFFEDLGESKSERIRLAVRDMWKPFRNATEAYAPQAAILYDKFHVLRHLGEALDQVRKREYSRLSGKDRSIINRCKSTCHFVAHGVVYTSGKEKREKGGEC